MARGRFVSLALTAKLKSYSVRWGGINRLRVALLQINPVAGDLKGNASQITRGVRSAQALGVDLVVTPELALMGYLPRDLLMSSGFVQRSCQMLSCLATDLKDSPAVLVAPPRRTLPTSDGLYSTARSC